MTTAKSIGEQLKSESKQVLSELQTLRDEIKLKLHLASAEGRDAWDKLEPQLGQLEQRLNSAAETAAEEIRTAGGELKSSLERFYANLKKS